MSGITEQALSDLILESQGEPTSQQEQVTETPTAPVTEAPITPEAPKAETLETPTQPTFNLDEELQKLTGGEIKSKDQLSEILGKTKGLSELEARLKTFEDENTSLKAQVNTSPFANDTIKKLNDLYSKNVPQHTIDAFMRINKVENIDDLQPLEARKLALQIKEGLSSEEAEDYINGTYKLVASDPDDDGEVAKVKIETLRLKLDSNADKEFLKTHKADVSREPVDANQKQVEQQQQDLQKHVATLQPIVKNISNELAFKDININGKEGEAAIKMDFDLTPESKESLEPALLDYIAKNGANIPNNQEGIDHLKTVGNNILVLQNWKKWISDATNNTDKRVRAEYHNPTTPNRGNDNPTPGKTSKDELAQWVLENS